MAKKKLLLFAAILTVLIGVFQIYTLMKYDHFEAEGGQNVEFVVDPTVILKKYGRESLNFDYVMKGMNSPQKLNRDDFLNAFAKSNKDRAKEPLVLLTKYKEIPELSINSSDTEVLDFLREELNKNLDESAEFVKRRTEKALDYSPQFKMDYENVTFSANIIGKFDPLWYKQLIQSSVTLGFHEIMTPAQLGNDWNKVCELTSPEPEMDSDIILGSIDQLDTKRRLSNCVKWEKEGVAFVLNQDKAFVEEMLASDVVKEILPRNVAFRWSYKLEVVEQNRVWKLYPIQIPKGGVPIVSNEDIESATVANDEYGENVDLTMTKAGAEKWAKMTEENIGRCIAMCVNDAVVSAPMVINPIMDGRTQISGNDLSDLKDIVVALDGKNPTLHPYVRSQLSVKGNPPAINSLVQQVLIGVTAILFLFFSISYLRNFRA